MPRLNNHWIAAAALALFCCKPAAAPTPPPKEKRSPLTQAQLATTDAGIALGNLDSSIEGTEKLLARQGKDLALTRKLAGLLLLRAQILAYVTDYEKAATLGERAVAEFPSDASGYLLRARTRAALHRFDEALRDLDEAERRGAGGPEVDEARASIMRARGNAKDAAALLSRGARGARGARDAEKDRDTWSMGALAAAIGETGELARAEEMFEEAQHHMRDVSPFPLAWLYLQQGLMWQRAGDADRALELFAAAVDRVPKDAPAASHLAAMLSVKDKKAEAIRVLEPFAAFASTEDPECAGQLALLYEETGRKEDAARLHALVDARYDQLLAAHPEAYGDHAARFWLNGAGADLKKALAAAEKNVDAKQSEEAFELALTIALAAHEKDRSCALADRALARNETSRRLFPLAALAYDACGKAERAGELRADESAPH